MTPRNGSCNVNKVTPPWLHDRRRPRFGADPAFVGPLQTVKTVSSAKEHLFLKPVCLHIK